MAFNPVTVPVAHFITCVTLVESIIWFASSITLFFLHERVGGLDPDETKESFFVILNNQFYNLYLKVIEGYEDERNVTEMVFFIFIVVYVLVTLAWLIISGYQYWLVSDIKRGKLLNIRNIFLAWIIITSIISVIDLVFGILLSMDYNEVKMIDNDLVYSAIIIEGIMVFVAFRGFVLWILNLIFVGIMTYFVYLMMKKENVSSTHDQSPIQAFDPPRPASWFAEAVNDEEAMPRMVHVDQAFIDVGDTNQFQDGARSLYSQRTDSASIQMGSGYEPRTPKTPQSYGSYQDHGNETGSNSSLFHFPSNQYRSAPTTPEPNYAKIGKKGLRPNAAPYKTAPPVVPLFPPYIPPPDYSPPESPVLRARPVLKNNPIY